VHVAGPQAIASSVEDDMLWSDGQQRHLLDLNRGPSLRVPREIVVSLLLRLLAVCGMAENALWVGRRCPSECRGCIFDPSISHVLEPMQIGLLERRERSDHVQTQECPCKMRCGEMEMCVRTVSGG